MARMQDAVQVLRKYYGYPAFRQGQEQIIGAVLEGRDTLGIMPTGGGKSIGFQVPAMLLPGTTLVISPLISLMKDQVDHLNELGIPAAFINSSLGAAETRDRLREAANGGYKLLYIAPERLETDSFDALLQTLQVPLVAVDEAHCVSQWGHDFRPSYVQVARMLQRMPRRPIIAAFTATATEEVKHDIVRLLTMQEPEIVVTGFGRDNLALSVIRGESKKQFLLDYIAARREQSGIVYAATRREVEDLEELLCSKGFAAGKYHGGLTDEVRAESQEAFLYDDVRVMVATNAFGMGIDKSNVRYVLHYSMPRNMEAYYQEAGRAGRDGEQSECALLYAPQDVMTQKFLIEQSVSSPDRKAMEYRKLQDMIDYCHTQQCLGHAILTYFGEDPTGRPTCGKCSSCTDESDETDITIEAQKIFSCIYRMQERFGTTLVAQVLRGSKNKRILELRLDRLSTYGVMSEYGEKEIALLLQGLVADGYLALSEGQYPVVRLQQKALRVLKGEEQVLRRVPKRKAAPSSALGAAGAAVFELLRGLRKELAEQERVPPYVIFADSTLREMSEALPQTAAELLTVKGVGEAKFRKYGARFLALLQQAAAEQGYPRPGMEESGGLPVYEAPLPDGEHPVLAGTRNSALLAEAAISQREQGASGGVFAAPAASRSGEESSHLQTYRLYAEGADLEAVAAARGLTLVTVQEHVLRAASEGKPLEWSRIIPHGQEELVLEAVRQAGRDKLRPIKEALAPGADVDYFVIKAVLMKNPV
ncbi:DNA helicase RecQ [Paenibacillus sp. y28]|uniref:DNA helicase RecQ n=1 Tax=Paenibacillus sp. y28 TaxID=3129110 RepID=UPI0030197BAC